MKRFLIRILLLSLLLGGCTAAPIQTESRPTQTTAPLTEPTTPPTTVPVTEPVTVPTNLPTTVPETEPTVPEPEKITAQPGLPTIANLLATSLLPVGQTMYVWGGGWNETDDGAGIEAVTIGVSDHWRDFFMEQDSNYDSATTRFQIHDGLDCSGYVGWLIYNTLNTESGGEGYVMPSTQMAQIFADMGFGELVQAQFCPGDIVSMAGHVWVCLGSCEDGSVLLVHSSPAGVSICGTAENGKSMASEFAEKIMQEFYPDWYEKFPDCSRSSRQYLDGAVGILHWNRETLTDPEGFLELSANEIMELLLGSI